MLYYNRLEENFFIYTFYATSKKGLKSTRSNTYCQLFVIDKDFIYIVPIRKESKVLLAMKLFAKEIGIPEAIITDTSSTETL